MQVCSISTQVMMCVVVGWRGSLADLCYYPPLHGPLQRAEETDIVVVYLFPWRLVDLGRWNGIRRALQGLRCNFWGPKTSPPGCSLPSLQGIPTDHHGAGNPGSP